MEPVWVRVLVLVVAVVVVGLIMTFSPGKESVNVTGMGNLNGTYTRDADDFNGKPKYSGISEGGVILYIYYTMGITNGNKTEGWVLDTDVENDQHASGFYANVDGTITDGPGGVQWRAYSGKTGATPQGWTTYPESSVSHHKVE